jgi:hypothetical protein
MMWVGSHPAKNKEGGMPFHPTVVNQVILLVSGLSNLAAAYGVH